MSRIGVGRWEKLKVSENKIVYQCSECGNIESEPKDKCCLCKVLMIEEQNERVIQSL